MAGKGNLFAHIWISGREMIFRITNKLGDKIDEPPFQSVPFADNPYADWTLHLFRANRAQYIIVANTLSLYSFVMAGAGITDDNWLIKTTTSILRDFLKSDGYERFWHEWVTVGTDRYTFSKTRDRRVICSVNRLVTKARGYFEAGYSSLFQVSRCLNQTPLSLLDYRCPKEAFPDLVGRVDTDPFGGAELSD